ncbi:MAG: lysylphosphatidylglycerol synthase domain-containing protein [bacterium]|nr:lysylphosphatidylglycerol synthase domain-containing protein [bacterium]MDE0351819.1 lysylphosphatidylglycerol synthase domain-containing protein [bacterium]
MSTTPVLGRLLKILRVAYLAGLAVVIGWVARTEWDEVLTLLGNARPGLIVASLASSFILILIGAWFWTASLHIQGHGLDTPRLLTKATVATSRSLLARYVPGSVWFAVGRVALLRNAGVPMGPLSATAILEMATSLTVVLMSGLAVLGLSGGIPGGAVWMVFVAVALIVATAPGGGGRVMAWLAARRGIEFALDWRGYLRLIGINVVFWGWSAVTFLLYLRAFPAADEFRTLLIVGGFLLTWGIGFLAPFAPQGIGVFELTMATLLQAEGTAQTVVVLGGYRLVLLARDFIATTTAEFIATRQALREREPPGIHPESGVSDDAGQDPPGTPR